MHTYSSLKLVSEESPLVSCGATVDFSIDLDWVVRKARREGLATSCPLASGPAGAGDSLLNY